MKTAMKKTLIAFATVLSLSGAAFAMDPADKSSSGQTETLVQTSTHSIEAPTNEGFASKAGIDINPNFLPGL